MTAETELEWVTDTAQKWQELVETPDWLRLWLTTHGLSDSAGPAAVLSAVAAEYRRYAGTLAGREVDASRGSVQPASYVAEVLARSDAKPWPPSGYLCLVRGNDCPGHASKWMVCAAGPVSGEDVHREGGKP